MAGWGLVLFFFFLFCEWNTTGWSVLQELANLHMMTPANHKVSYDLSGGSTKGGARPAGEAWVEVEFLVDRESPREEERLGLPYMAQLVKILCKGGDNLYVSIRGDDVVLAREDPRDKKQQWFRDYSRSTHLPGDNDRSAFALVNKATRQVMVNKKTTAVDLSYFPVQLAPYNVDECADSTMLWTQLEKEHGDGFHQIAVLWNIGIVMDGLKGNVREGTIVGCDPTHYSYMRNVNDNQLWKILPVDGSSTYFTNFS